MLAPMSTIDRIARRLLARAAAIGADPRDDDEARIRKALLVVIAILILPISLVWGTLFIGLGAPSGVIAYLYFAISVVAIAVFARTRNARAFLRVELLDILLAPTISMAFVGGFIASGGVGLWGILGPLGALVFDGVRAGVRWFAAFVAVFLVSGIVGELTGGRSSLPTWFESTMIALNITVGGTDRLHAAGAVRPTTRGGAGRVADRAGQGGDAAAQHPAAVDRRQAQGRRGDDRRPIRRRVDPVRRRRRLHADGGADGAGRGGRHPRPPLQPLRRPRRAVRAREDQDDRRLLHGRGRRPTPRPDHARALARMAIDMRDAMRSEDGVGHLGLELRIGINSGPVVAGVIGRKRFLYDLWGDAVNTASRMESHGTPGQIQVTRATYELLKDEFVLEPRGTVDVKGKGEVETWYLVGERAEGRRRRRRPRERPRRPDSSL